jgi:hypothetical protein
MEVGAMLSFCQFGPCSFSVHFRVVTSQHVMVVVVAYVPMDMCDASIKDAFHLFLFGCLKVMPPIDKVVVLGDFNIELHRDWDSSVGAMGWHHLHHDEAPSHNGECFLDLATSFGLHVANTFFPHWLGHLGTWFHPPTQRWYVKDYIMCSHSLMCGVLDYRVFTNVCHGNNDHRLLASTLQLHL